MCRSGADRKRRQLAETEIRESTKMAFEVYGKQLKTAPSFKYLGIILTAGDDDWPAVTGNLGKARKSRGRLQRILSREGADKRVSGNFLKVVVQQVLLFGAETWVSLSISFLDRRIAYVPIGKKVRLKPRKKMVRH